MSTQFRDIEEIIDKYKLRLVVYFGSYKTEYYRSDSDIDIAYLSVTLLSRVEKMNLLHDLILAHRKSEIDLVDLRTAEPVLRYEIATKGRLLYEEEEGLFDRYSLYYTKRFYEMKPLIQAELDNIRKRISEVLDDG